MDFRRESLPTAVGFDPVSGFQGWHLRQAASFGSPSRLEDFDFTFNPAIPRARIHELAAYHFIRQKRDALLIGPPGVGKTHLAQAIGAEAIRSGFYVLYRSIFDLVRDIPSNASPAASAILERLLHRSDIIAITGPSYRLHQSTAHHLAATAAVTTPKNPLPIRTQKT